jgi:hypothetical protein
MRPRCIGLGTTGLMFRIGVRCWLVAATNRGSHWRLIPVFVSRASAIHFPRACIELIGTVCWALHIRTVVSEKSMFHFFRVIRRSAVRQVVHNFRGQHFVASVATALANASENQEHVGCTEKNVFQNSVIVLDGYGALPWLGQGWYVDVGFFNQKSRP